MYGLGRYLGTSLLYFLCFGCRSREHDARERGSARKLHLTAETARVAVAGFHCWLVDMVADHASQDSKNPRHEDDRVSSV
jgi:hypothetical protein